MEGWERDAGQVSKWDEQLEQLLLEMGDVFGRADLRRRAQACVRGLLGPVSRKNGWQLAEYAGWEHPWLQQHLLDRARWDENELRDRVRHYVLDSLAGGAGSVLVVDETGIAKKGHASAGVAPQYSGALGGVFPCQVGVVAAWATDRGQALIDRELYLPHAWTDDRARCRRAHVPDQVSFASKPALAKKIIDRILPDCPAGTWAAADEVYGRDSAFRAFLEQRQMPYVVTVPSSQTVLPRPGWRRIDHLAEQAQETEWTLLPAGPSTQGSRWWQWWIQPILDPEEPIGSGEPDGTWWRRWMIARRRPDQPGECDYYLAWGPADTPHEQLAYVAGARWRVEDAIKLAKHECGLADYEVRSWHGWYRHTTLAMLAAAFLAVQAATATDTAESADGKDLAAAVGRDNKDPIGAEGPPSAAKELVKKGSSATPQVASYSSGTPLRRSGRSCASS